MRSKRKSQETRQKRTMIAGAMREGRRVKRFIRLNSRNRLVSMQRERRLGKKMPGNDEKLNESGKKSRESGTKGDALNNALLMSNERRKDKSDMNVGDERIPARGIEAIIFLEAMTVTKVQACQHRDIETMTGEQDLERARPRLLLLRHRRLQLMIRHWRKQLYNYF